MTMHCCRYVRVWTVQCWSELLQVRVHTEIARAIMQFSPVPEVSCAQRCAVRLPATPDLLLHVSQGAER